MLICYHGFADPLLKNTSWTFTASLNIDCSVHLNKVWENVEKAQVRTIQGQTSGLLTLITNPGHLTQPIHVELALGLPSTKPNNSMCLSVLGSCEHQLAL